MVFSWRMRILILPASLCLGGSVHIFELLGVRKRSTTKYLLQKSDVSYSTLVPLLFARAFVKKSFAEPEEL
jgi:hypothetical protein